MALPDPDWATVVNKLAVYLELLLKWNSRTNLTAIRDPEEIVARHFGESLFTGLLLRDSFQLSPGSTVLDFGSGAGFPGLPIQLLFPTLHVTLAESQGKKAAFLHEAVRVLDVPTEVWASRVEAMPAARRFQVVTLRAVDDMASAVALASGRAERGLAILATRSSSPSLLPSGSSVETISLPNSEDGVLLLVRR